MPRPASSTERGYGSRHQKLRAALLADLALHPGQPCWRCGQPMTIDMPLDLGHDDNDRTLYRGLEHRGRCNRAAAARKANRLRGMRRRAQVGVIVQPITSRRW